MAILLVNLISQKETNSMCRAQVVVCFCNCGTDNVHAQSRLCTGTLHIVTITLYYTSIISVSMLPPLFCCACPVPLFLLKRVIVFINEGMDCSSAETACENT